MARNNARRAECDHYASMFRDLVRACVRARTLDVNGSIFGRRRRTFNAGRTS